MKFPKFFLVLFLSGSVMELAVFFMSNSALHFVAKPLIVPSLIGYYLAQADKRSAAFISAMLFCWAGDVLLLYQDSGEIYFRLGLVAFLIGHGLYIIAYRTMRWVEPVNGLSGSLKIVYGLPVVLAGAVLFIFLYPNLGGLRVPVMVYSVALVSMVIAALFRSGRTSPPSFGLVLTGAIMFMISDSVLAINKFLMPVSMGGFLIMATYILAQYLIVEGMVRHSSRPVN